jgi:hypothetical protein
MITLSSASTPWTLRNFGLKVGVVGKMKFEARIKELVENLPDLANWLLLVLLTGLLVALLAILSRILLLLLPGLLILIALVLLTRITLTALLAALVEIVHLKASLIWRLRWWTLGTVTPFRFALPY